VSQAKSCPDTGEERSAPAMAEDAAAAAAADAPEEEKTLNVNLGVLGHVDSGKTSLVRALSVTLSTAALDKAPEEKARGITLDLGFSSFTVAPPPVVADAGYAKMQYTLVDCPGHASLIRTIMGGAQIIDMMLLIIDVTKGIQTQTAECVVIGEILADKFLIILNKVDLLPEETREKKLAKTMEVLRKQLGRTKLGRAPMIGVAASPGGDASKPGIGLEALVEKITSMVELPERTVEGDFRFAIDHCFQIRGQGTVLTGTCLSGQIGVGEVLELPAFKLEKKIKSMQMFHKPATRIQQGDRAGICVTQLDAKILERGLAAKPNSVPPIDAAMLRVHRVRFFKGEINSDVRGSQKYHVTVGHQTVMATVCFMELPGSSSGGASADADAETGTKPGERPMTPAAAAAERPMTPAEDPAQESKDAQVARLAKLDESEGGEAAEAAEAELSAAADEFEPFDFDREYEFLPTLEKRGPKSGARFGHDGILLQRRSVSLCFTL
jgi:selenocysteine-specific elongation factor